MKDVYRLFDSFSNSFSSRQKNESCKQPRQFGGAVQLPVLGKYLQIVVARCTAHSPIFQSTKRAKAKQEVKDGSMLLIKSATYSCLKYNQQVLRTTALSVQTRPNRSHSWNIPAFSAQFHQLQKEGNFFHVKSSCSHLKSKKKKKKNEGKS